MGLKDLFKRKRTPFEELWKQVEGIPDGAKKQLSADLSDKTKRKLEKLSPKEIEDIVNGSLEEVSKGSIVGIDELIRKMIN